DFAQAATYFRIATKRAIGVFAYKEAVLLARRNLTALAHLPQSSSRLQAELDAHLDLGISLLSIRGYGSPEVRETYANAQTLSKKGGNTAGLFTALWGQYSFLAARLELKTAGGVADQLYKLASQSPDPDFPLTASLAVGVIEFFSGKLTP